MIELLLKSSIAIGIAFLFYKLLLQQESFFATNRLYLLGCIALAFALPYVTLPKLINQQGVLAAVFQQETAPEIKAITEAGPTKNKVAIVEPLEKTSQVTESETRNSSLVLPQQGSESIGTQAAVTEEVAGNEGFSLLFWLLMLYLFGVAIFTLSLLFQVGSVVYKIITATDKIQDGDCVIVNTASRQAPCSFFKYIFIYPDDYDYETYEQIIAHEKVHARLGHSLDLLIAEIAVIVLWFNPLIWLFKREIEKNIEYQTDAVLLEKEQVRKDQYQLNLLQIAVPNKPLNITTNYNQSLIKQRIMMMNAKRSTPHAYWKYAFLMPLFFGLLLLINEPATSQDKEQKAAAFNVNEVSRIIEKTAENVKENFVSGVTQTGKKEAVIERESDGAVGEPLPSSPAGERLPVQPQREPAGPARELQGPSRGMSLNISNSKQNDMSEGYWYSNRENGKYCIQFRGSKESSNWNMSECFDAGAFQKKGNDVFVMNKEAGTLQLTGKLDAEVGQGKYKFTEDASFKKYLADNNISSRDKNLMFFLFFGDVSKSYVAYLMKEYDSVNGDRLLELAIHGVPEKSFRNYVALFQKHSNKKPSIQEVVEARIHGIDETYVQEIQKMGFKDLSLNKMMEAKIHGVSASYVESLKKAGFGNLSMDRIIEARIHDVKPATIKEMRALGFGDLSLQEIIELQIHDVDAAYISDLKSAGLNNLTMDQVMEAKIHDLNAASVKEIRALGFKDLSLSDLMSARIHGVDAAYVNDLKKAGFPNLSMDDIVEAKIHGINSNFIQKARKDGYDLNSIDKYISLKIHGSAIESLKDKD